MGVLIVVGWGCKDSAVTVTVMEGVGRQIVVVRRVANSLGGSVQGRLVLQIGKLGLLFG